MIDFWYFSFNTLKIFYCALTSIIHGKRSVEFLTPVRNIFFFLSALPPYVMLPFLCMLSRFCFFKNFKSFTMLLTPPTHNIYSLT